MRLVELTVVTWRGALTFVLLGPALGAVGAGALQGGAEGLPLVAIYGIGGMVALLAWIVHSAAMLVIAQPLRSHLSSHRETAYLLSTLVGAVAGYIIVCVPACIGKFGPDVGIRCFAVVLKNMWAISVFPGAICGFIAASWFKIEMEFDPEIPYRYHCPQCDAELEPEVKRCPKCPAIFTRDNGWRVVRRQVAR